MLGDPVRLRQVISHLLTNAQKFTDRGSVTYMSKLVGLEGFVATILVVVKDTGYFSFLMLFRIICLTMITQDWDC